ncbi:hypothetical protein ACWD4B_12530 [Streptomyces sp. NPDC002536]
MHISNSIADGERFGQSSLATMFQTLDELAETDTDSARASATTGAPISKRKRPSPVRGYPC